jgi:hypothetical protein
MDNAAKIFLCHSSGDKDFVRQLAQDLRKSDVPVWFDEWEIMVGDSLNQKIGEGITESGWLAVILSLKSVQSKWVQKELNAGLAKELEKKKVFVLPILVEDCDIPVFLLDKVYADFRRDYNDGLSRLLKRLILEMNDIEALKNAPTDLIVTQMNNYTPQDYIVKIIDVNVEGEDEQYPGLYVVAFHLNQIPDVEWVQLFENLLRYIVSIPIPTVEDDIIYLRATEKHIKEDKHRIYGWVEDANQRFQPIVHQRIQQQSAEYQKEQLERNKFAELTNLLKGDKTKGILVIPSGVVMIGLCSLKMNGCTAHNDPAPITAIHFENHGQMNICNNCFKQKIATGEWRL